MAATTRTRKNVKKAPARKFAKKYRLVEFESDLFEGVFRLPDMKQMPVKVIAALNKGDVAVIIPWCIAAGASTEDAEVIGELDAEELPEFIEAWGEGALPKS